MADYLKGKRVLVTNQDYFVAEAITEALRGVCEVVDGDLGDLAVTDDVIHNMKDLRPDIVLHVPDVTGTSLHVRNIHERMSDMSSSAMTEVVHMSNIMQAVEQAVPESFCVLGSILDHAIYSSMTRSRTRVVSEILKSTCRHFHVNGTIIGNMLVGEVYDDPKVMFASFTQDMWKTPAVPKLGFPQRFNLITNLISYLHGAKEFPNHPSYIWKEEEGKPDKLVMPFPRMKNLGISSLPRLAETIVKGMRNAGTHLSNYFVRSDCYLSLLSRCETKDGTPPLEDPTDSDSPSVNICLAEMLRDIILPGVDLVYGELYHVDMWEGPTWFDKQVDQFQLVGQIPLSALADVYQKGLQAQ